MIIYFVARGNGSSQFSKLFRTQRCCKGISDFKEISAEKIFMSRGRLITLEGSEGVGKSTNLDVVCKFLEEKRIRFTVTREPGELR